MAISKLDWTCTGSAKASGTTANGTVTGTDTTLQPGDIVILVAAFDNLTPTTPTVTQFSVGTNVTRLYNSGYFTNTTAAGSAAGAVLVHLEAFRVDVATTLSPVLTLSANVTAKAFCGTAFRGVDTTSVWEENVAGGNGVQGAASLTPPAGTWLFCGTASEGPAAATIGGTWVTDTSASTSGGGSASNASAGFQHRVGDGTSTAAQATLVDGGIITISFKEAVTLTSVTASCTTTWNVLQQVTQNRNSSWNVAGATAPVTASRTTTWNVRQAVTQAKSTTWNVRQAVTQTRTTTWNVAGTTASVSANRLTTWNVLQAVTASRTTTWDALTQITQNRNTTWNVNVTAAGITAPTLVASYTSSNSRVTAALPSFTVPNVQVGDLLIFKGMDEGSSTNGDASSISAPSTSGETWTVIFAMTPRDATHTNALMYSCIAASAGSKTVSFTNPSGQTKSKSGVIEHWRGAQLPTPLVTDNALGSGAPSRTITTTQDNSVVSWTNGDWAAVSTSTAAYRSGATQEFKTGTSGSDYGAYYARQDAATAGSQTYGMTAPTGQTWHLTAIEIQGVASGPTTTPVTASVTTTWNVAQTITAERVTTWNTRASVTATQTTTWNVLKSVTQARTTTWNALQQVTSNRNSTWNVAGTIVSVTAARTTTWNVTQAVTAARTTTWNVRASVTQAKATTWNVRATVTQAKATTWNVLAQVTDTQSTTWNVLAAVTQARTTTWNALQQVTSNRNTTWNVGGTGTQTYTIWAPDSGGASIVGDLASYTLATQFKVSQDAQLTGVWFYSAPGAGELPSWAGVWRVSDHTAVAVQNTSTLANLTWSGAPGSGWVKATFDGSVTLSATDQYKVAVFGGAGAINNWYSATSGYFNSAATVRGILTAPKTADSDIGNGTFNQNTWAYPANTFNDTNYWVDVEVQTGSGGLASVTAARTTTWNTRTSVTASRSTTWNAATTVAATRSTTWVVRASVTATRSSSWNTTAPVTATRVTTWNALKTVTAARTSTWNALQQVTANRNSTWNVSGQLITVTSARTTTWNTFARVTDTQATTWNVLATVSQSRTTTWNVLVPIAAPATRTTTWNVLQSSTTSRTTTWNTLKSISSARTTTWNALQQVTSIRNSTWNVSGPIFSVTANRATTWNTLVRVTDAQSTTWNVRAAVTQVRTTTWNVKGQVTAARLTTWNTRQQISAARTTTWNTLIYLVLTRTTTWRTRAEVTSTRATMWNVASNGITWQVERPDGWLGGQVMVWNDLGVWVPAQEVVQWDGTTWVHRLP